MPLDQFKDKPNFTLTLLAAALAGFAFKNELQSFVFPLGLGSINALQVIIVFVVLLGISAYLYALDYIRTYKMLENHMIARWILPAANTFYAVAVIFPIFLIVVGLLSYGFQIVTSQLPILARNETFMSLSWFFTPIIGYFAGYYAVGFARDLTKSMQNKAARQIKDSDEKRFESVITLYNEKLYGAMILEVYKIIDSNLRIELIHRGYLVDTLTSTVILQIAAKEKIVTPDEVKKLHKLRTLRNQASHLTIEFDKAQADFALEVAQDILKKLQEMKTKTEV